MADFGLSFTRAGALATAFFVVSGVGQSLAGVRGGSLRGAARALRRVPTRRRRLE
jgi:hypothetical protein